MVVSTGVLWDLVEWLIMDLPAKRNDKADTLEDLCLDAAGAFVGAVVV